MTTSDPVTPVIPVIPVTPAPAPEVAALLERFAASGSPALHELGVDGARAATRASARVLQRPPPPVARVHDGTTPGGTPVRVYDPDPDVALPLLVYVHGGGWVTGDLDVVDGPCRRLATATGRVVASVGYRRSPEARFPGPLLDVRAAVSWLAGQQERLGTTAGPPALMGDSAGATLALGVALTAPSAVGSLVLLYPPLLPPDPDRFASHRPGPGDAVLSSATMAWFWRQYLPPGAPPDGLAAPLLAPSFAGLPPTLLVTAGLDVLHDEGVELGRRLGADGVEVTCRDVPGTTHGFFWMDRLLPQADAVLDDVVRHLGPPRD